MKLSENVTKIKGIGDKTAKILKKLGIENVSELIEHYPRYYDIYELPIPIDSVEAGDTVTIEGSVCSRIEQRHIRNLMIISCHVKDPSGSIRLTWFNQPYLINSLKPGIRLLFRGKPVRKNAELVIEQPVIYGRDDYRKLLSVMQPVYALTEGLSNNILIKAIRNVLPELDISKDYLPLRIRQKLELINYKDAVNEIHFPKDNENMLIARRRLVFDEFLLFALSVRRMKEQKDKQFNKYIINDCDECKKLIKKLPYSLTDAQRKVLDEVFTDLKSNISMSRMIQGDVGCGKTIIAVLALLMVVKNGYQGCLMVPTEVLAKQHYRELNSLLAEYGVKTELLTGSIKGNARKEAYLRIEKHEVDIIVGTHALIQERVKYDRLALVITDEQHRFGVKQREKLGEKGEERPHMLVMSATPIPRSLAIILYGDLSLSVINEIPAERLPNKNCVVDTGYRQNAYRFILNQVKEGRQAYIICAMVEESENVEAENVIEYTEKVIEAINDNSIRIEFLHGKMKTQEKNDIMERFTCGAIDILISTTVVEVGVNVQNATVMMIENSERFGLAQLHQLRGRVGRGKYQSYCIFIKGKDSKEVTERLEILNKTNDGFKIAEQDLKLRGPGDIFGIRQSGDIEFKLGDIFGDADVLKLAGDIADELSEAEADMLMYSRISTFGSVNLMEDVIL